MQQKNFPQYLAEVTNENPHLRVSGALRLSRDFLRVEALALTLVSTADQKPRLVAHDGYDPKLARVLTEDRFGATPRRIHRFRTDPKSVYPWDRSGFAEDHLARERFMPAGFRNGITLPLTSRQGVIFGFLHTNITRPRFSAETESLLQETGQKMTRTAWMLHERINTELTNREIEVLALLRQGLSTPEIGELLFVSPRTIATHIEHLLRKTGSSNRVQAAIWAERHGI